MTRRIAMWSGPRNLSTAMMYSFGNRTDCDVSDEPFYAAFLRQSGARHPMRDTVMAVHDTDADRVAGMLRGPAPNGAPIWYQKHMCHQMVAGIPRGWMAEVENVFLIRHPVRVVASYVAKNEKPTAADIGFAAQAELFDLVSSNGVAPLVIESADIRARPRETLGALCGALGIPFTDRMLSWAAGPRPQDGAWASHWYDAVHQSTGFAGAEGDLPTLSGEAAALASEAMPHYIRLKGSALKT